MSRKRIVHEDAQGFDRSPPHDYNVGIVAELLGAFEQAVLLTVSRLRDEAYGRAILRTTQTILGRSIAAGAIYATLDRLEQKNLLSSRIEKGTPQRGGRARRYYMLTGAGARALNESKAALENMWRGTKWPLEAQI